MNTGKRAVVLISGSGSNLQALIDQIDIGMLDCQIVLVISNVESVYGLERASKASINSVCIKHTDFESRLAFDRELINCIDQTQPDIVILAGFMRILTEEFVRHYEKRLINIHPSLLPKYPGNNTHQRVLAAGEQQHGASIHFVVPEVDAGPVILQGQIQVHACDTVQSLQQRIHKVEHQIYPLAVSWFIQDRLSIRDGQVLLDDEISSLQLQSFDV